MKFPIIIYHGVHSKEHPHTFKNDRMWTIDIKTFERQMKFIHASGCQVVLLSHLLDGTAPAPSKNKNTVVLTFDDGHESNYLNALPVLKKYGFKAEFFITAGLISKNGYMSPSQLVDLKKHGMSIQSHAYNHRFLSLLDREDLFLELHKSKKQISDIISDEVRFFAYPGGRYNDQTEATLQQVGYLGSCTSDTGYNTVNKNFFALKRFHYIQGMKDRYFRAIISQDSIYFLLRKIWSRTLAIKRKLAENQAVP